MGWPESTDPAWLTNFRRNSEIFLKGRHGQDRGIARNCLCPSKPAVHRNNHGYGLHRYREKKSDISKIQTRFNIALSRMRGGKKLSAKWLCRDLLQRAVNIFEGRQCRRTHWTRGHPPTIQCKMKTRQVCLKKPPQSAAATFHLRNPFRYPLFKNTVKLFQQYLNRRHKSQPPFRTDFSFTRYNASTNVLCALFFSLLLLLLFILPFWSILKGEILYLSCSFVPSSRAEQKRGYKKGDFWIQNNKRFTGGQWARNDGE